MTGYLNYITKSYSLQLIVKDFVGFIRLNNSLYYSLEAFLSHESPYCNYLKSDRQICKKCLSMTKKLMLHCSKHPDGFFGYCYAGIGEYVFPIIADGSVIGSINIGLTCLSSERIEKHIKRMCRGSQIDASQALRFYHSLPVISRQTIEDIKPLIKFCSRFLSLAYALTEQGNTVKHVSNYTSSGDSIFHRAITFLNSHYTEKCTVQEIAEYCNCSTSYINHLIKKRVGTGIRKTINKLRIEESKRLLISTDNSLSMIAEEIGFEEQNYFTKVFKEFTGMTPFMFRKRNRHI